MNQVLNILLLLVILFASSSNLVSQKHDNTWILGYNGTGYHIDARLAFMNFENNEMMPITYFTDSLNYFRYAFNFTATIMSDAEGDLVFYYNGFQIRDRFNQVPIGGDTLNEFWFWNNFTGTLNNGIPIPQSSIALPIPESNNVYVLLSSTPSLEYFNIGKVVADKIFVHEVKETLNGLDVLSSNQTILNQDRLTPGGFTSVRHANGRDWWLLFGRVAENLEYLEGFQKYLLTPNGLEYQDYTSFDIPVYAYGAGQFCYNRDGTKLIMATTRLNTDPFNLVIVDFDRCTGQFSNWIQTAGPVIGHVNGCAVSPNNRYLYVSNYFEIYQYDLEAEDIFASEQLIGEVDPSIGSPNFIAIAGNAQLAPDGKIYFANGNSTTALCVIHHPDSAGLASGFEQGGFELGVYNFRSIPNFPNYCLGALEGSLCDTLGWTYDNCKVDSIVSVQEVVESDIGDLIIHPNPTSSIATVQIPGPGRLAVYDIHGRLRYQNKHVDAGTYELNTGRFAAGVYIVLLQTEYGSLYRARLGVFRG